jgi:Ca2+-binding RTX toxin-like protein
VRGTRGAIPANVCLAHFGAMAMSTPTFEILEPRKLLSAASLRHGVLTVTGTDRPDTINVKNVSRANAAEKVVVSVNGRSQSFRASSVKSLNITTRKGNDLIDVARNVDARTRIDAGAGDDEISVAEFDDLDGEEFFWDDEELELADEQTVTVLGGKGDDYITCTLATLIADGGWGDDCIFSGGGDDCLDGGDGDDQIDGGWGDDELNGDEGDDLLDGDYGDDELDGGWGEDELDGGWGDDELDGDEGNDFIYGEQGFDWIDDLFGENFIWQD